MDPQRPSTHDLLDDYLSLDLSLPQLARRHAISLRALIEFLDARETRRTLDDLRRLAARRASDASVHARTLAIHTLVIHATADPGSESARRAATELLRDRVRVRRPRRATKPPKPQARPVPRTDRPRPLPPELRRLLRYARIRVRQSARAAHAATLSRPRPTPRSPPSDQDNPCTTA